LVLFGGEGWEGGHGGEGKGKVKGDDGSIQLVIVLVGVNFRNGYKEGQVETESMSCGTP